VSDHEAGYQQHGQAAAHLAIYTRQLLLYLYIITVNVILVVVSRVVRALYETMSDLHEDFNSVRCHFLRCFYPPFSKLRIKNFTIIIIYYMIINLTPELYKLLYYIGLHMSQLVVCQAC
jgi:hypothetical protein